MRVSIFWILLLLASPILAQEVPEKPKVAIHYALSMPQPTTHLFHVEMTVTHAPGNSLDLVLPVWTPGSYKVRDYAQLIQDMDAGDLPLRKVDKTTWRITHQGAEKVRVTYKSFAHTISVRHSFLDSEQGTAVGATLFFYVKGHQAGPHSLQVKTPSSWKIATGLPQKEDGRFHAENYDVLIDSPLVMSDFRSASFEVQGVVHRIVLSGPAGVDLEKMRGDFQKIVEATVAIFGEIPYKDYTFLIRAWPSGGGGGLEHLNSTLMDASTVGLGTQEGYRGLLSLTAHEFFHTWLVKRIRPKTLGPFDYTKENYTGLLWVMEGITSYYTPVILHRAGLATEKKRWESYARTLSELQGTPGRLREGPELASYNAWIHFYQTGPQFVNTSASYYSTGMVLGLALDLRIRSMAGKSLDAVMNHLYEEYYKRQKRGLTEAEFQKACETVAGGSLDALFAESVRKGNDPDLDADLQAIGVQQINEGKSEPYLGVRFSGNSITHVIEGGPAWKGGLCVEDELLALDGIKLNVERWADHVASRKEGSPLRFTLFRKGVLKDVTLTFARKVRAKYRMQRVEKPSEQQEKAYRAFLGGN